MAELNAPQKGRAGDDPGGQSFRALLGLRDLIFSGAAAPGARITEPWLAKRLGLSRTPVRAALLRLEGEGLVEALPGGGHAVRVFTHADVADAIELRGVLEGAVARIAAERGAPPEALAALTEAADAIDAALSASELKFERYAALNDAFHAGLARLPGSSLLEREIARVKALAFAAPSAFVAAQAQLPAFRAVLIAAQAQHRALIEAIERREGARAEALAREHARLAQRNLTGVIANGSLSHTVPGLALVAG